MGKRFTDVDKWKDEWFLSLSNDHRIVWQYICDNCTPAGRLKKNFKLLNFCCYTNLDDSSFTAIFNGRAMDRGDYYFFPKFLKFQYPKGLNSEKPAIISIRNELQQYGLIQIVKESLGNDYLIVKDKDKDKDKDKESGTRIDANYDNHNIKGYSPRGIPNTVKEIIDSRKRGTNASTVL